MKIRRVASLIMLFALAIMAVSGVVLFIVPHGRVAYWSGWTLAGLSKTRWGDVHTTMGLLMLVAGAFHVVFNWRSIMVYLKTRSRELRIVTPEFNTALIVTAVVVSFTLLELPPVTWVVDLAARIKDDAVETYGEPPYGHAEQSTLAAFCLNMRWDEEESLAALRAAGVAFEDDGLTLLEVADANGMTPQDVFEAMRPASADSAGRGGHPEAKAGLGRRNLAAVGEELGIGLDAVLEILESEGISASGSSTLRSLAEDAGRSPRDIYEAVRRAAERESGTGET